MPPNYDPNRKYPLGIFLHGAAQDELFFLQAHVRLFDQAIYEGRMPPMILAAPDGSIHGQASFVIPATFWADSKAGAFERYVMCDVWNYLHENFPIRPEREAHSITGVSMGGGAAVGLAIKYRAIRFKTWPSRMMPLVSIPLPSTGQGKYRDQTSTPSVYVTARAGSIGAESGCEASGACSRSASIPCSARSTAAARRRSAA